MGSRGQRSNTKPIKQDFGKLSKKEKAFLESYVFAGHDVDRISNSYLEASSVSRDGDHIILRVGDAHLRPTPYGQALHVTADKVVYVKDWQVSTDRSGNQVVALSKKYWNVRPSNVIRDELTGASEKNTKWETWKQSAKKQKSVLWRL